MARKRSSPRQDPLRGDSIDCLIFMDDIQLLQRDGLEMHMEKKYCGSTGVVFPSQFTSGDYERQLPMAAD